MNSEIASLFLSSKFSDITLKLVEPESITESGQVENVENVVDQTREVLTEVPAHSFILKLRSAYFETRFNFEASTATSPSRGGRAAIPETLEIHLADITKSTFMAMLEFLYRDKVPKLNGDSLVAMLIAADFYQIPSLRRHCLQTMKAEILNTRNMFALLLKFHSDYPLMAKAKAACLDYIDNHFDELKMDYSSLEMQDLPRELLCEVIRRDSLNADEKKIASRVIGWAEEACRRQGMAITGADIRQVIGEALYLVRFPLIDPKWFGDQIVCRKILTDEEVLGVFLRNNMTNPPSTPFSSVRRNYPSKPSPAVYPTSPLEKHIYRRIEGIDPGYHYHHMNQ